ncbi:MAG: tetratricopeptide repeat protein, partial [Candidatus Binatia bacterium]
MMKKVLVLLLYLLWPIQPGLIHSEPREPFPSAYSFFSQGDFSKAEDLFLEALDHASVLEDYTLYFLGMISFHQEALHSARNYFSQLNKRFPKSVWVNHANLHLAKIALKEGNGDQALERLMALETRGVGDPITNEALFLIGQTYKERGELDRATSFYQKLRTGSPLSPWAHRAKKEVQSLREQHPQLLGLREPEAILEEGELLLLERDYDEAERVFQRSSSVFSERDLRLRYLLGLAEVYRKSRKRQKESDVLAEIVEQYPGSTEAPTALARLAEVYWNRGKNLKALAEFKRLKERYPNSPVLDFAAFASARIYESLRKQKNAIRIYLDFPKRFPKSPLREQAAWRLAWIHYLQA